MDSWWTPADILLSKTDRRYKTHRVKQVAYKMIQASMWRGARTGDTRIRVWKAKRADSVVSPRRESSRSWSCSPPPKKISSKAKRDKATQKKATDAAATTLKGVRRSARVRVSTKKVLDARREKGA